ncbi:MAG TPA: TIGR01777 family oxidoreductase [Acidimicrobiales bacterium]|jgi:hypothetical protein|nr:TIGR01777 family oxidoreductase [Acidimicrobiales bacterium]
MPVLVTGASGLIGSALLAALPDARSLRRGSQWDPEQGVVDPAVLEGVDAVVHLAGAGIGDHRWTPEYKRRILDSRVNGTRALAGAAASSGSVRTFVCASAVGYYGDRGDEPVTEESPPGTGFLADVVRQWEAACAPAADAGVRVVNLRSGIVLSPEGGALKKQLLPFKAGLGGRLGSGRQWVSWISLADEVGVIRTALHDAGLVGPVNVTAPEPVTSAGFAKALGRALHRPAVMPVPAFGLRVLFGRDMADEMLLAGQRVLPAKLQSNGFNFQHPTLDRALEGLG